MREIKIFKKGVPLASMQDLATPHGQIITDFINTESDHPKVIEDLYASTNDLFFSYPVDGNLKDLIVNDNYVRVPVQNGQHNLYRITRVESSSDYTMLEVEANHWTLDYMSAKTTPLNLNYEGESYYEDIVAKAVRGGFVNLNISIGVNNLSRYKVANAWAKQELDDDGTVGKLLAGPSSFVRQHANAVIYRELTGISIVSRPLDIDWQTPENYIIEDTINIEDYGWERDTVEKYTHKIVDVGSVPTFYKQGDGRYGVLSGIGGSKFNSFNDIPEGFVFDFLYKGLPITAKRQNNILSYNIGALGNEAGELVGAFKDTALNLGVVVSITPDTPNNLWHLHVTIKMGVNTHTLISEPINFDYLYAYNVDGNFGTVAYDLEYLGIPNDLRVEVEEEDTGTSIRKIYTYLSTVVEPNKFLYPVRIAGKESDIGRNMFPVKYEEGVTHGSKQWHFYDWLFNKFPSSPVKKEDYEFEINIDIDDFTNVYGEYMESDRALTVGKVYPAYIRTYDVKTRGEIVKTTYDVVRDVTETVSFSNRNKYEPSDYDAKKQEDLIRKTKKTETDNKGKTNDIRDGGPRGGGSKPLITLYKNALKWDGVTNSSVMFKDNLKSAHDAEDGDITSKVSIQSSESQATYTVTDSDGNTDIKTATMDYGDSDDDDGGTGGPEEEVDIFDGNLEYEARTDDSGIPYFQWSENVITVPIGAEESTPSKLLAFNGAEAVLDEVRLDRDTVTGGELVLNAIGHFFNNSVRERLPKNDGYAIIPNPKPDVSSGTRSWPPVYTNAYTSNLKKGDSYSMYQSFISEDDFNELLELYENRNFRYIDFKTKGTLVTNAKEREDNNKLFFLSSGMGNGAINVVEALMMQGREDFNENVIRQVIGKTMSNRGYQEGSGSSTLQDYIEPGGVKRVGLKTPYYKFLKQVIRGAGRSSTQTSPASGIWLVQNGLMEVHWEKVDFRVGDYTHEITDIVVHWDLFTTHPSYKELVTRTQGWQGVFFTQPVTKVDGKTVKMPGLLLNNGGPTVFNAMLNKTEIDRLWKSLTPEQKKDFEFIYGSEQGYNNDTYVLKYADDDYLLSYHFKKERGLNLVEYDNMFDSKMLTNREHTIAYKRVEARTLHKYSYLVSQGYTVTANDARLKTWDELIQIYDNPE